MDIPKTYKKFDKEWIEDKVSNGIACKFSDIGIRAISSFSSSNNDHKRFAHVTFDDSLDKYSEINMFNAWEWYKAVSNNPSEYKDLIKFLENIPGTEHKTVV